MQILITCEHGGNHVPSPYRTLFRGAKQQLSGHHGYDTGALAVAGGLAGRLGAQFFFSEVTRLLIDLNRSLRHPKLFSKITKGLPAVEKQDIQNRYYLPYRTEVQSSVSGIISGGRAALHISVHTFSPVLNGQRRNADIGLLYDPSRPLEKSLCINWQKAIISQGHEMIVRRNYPYSGVSDGLVTHLRKLFPPDRYVGIELEINQKLIEHQTGRYRLLFDTLESGLRSACGC